MEKKYFMEKRDFFCINEIIFFISKTKLIDKL